MAYQKINRRRKMCIRDRSASSITKDIHAVGILNPAMRIFDVVMKTEYGTSYNSYIVKGAEKTALIETCHLTFFDQYLDNICLLYTSRCV